MDPFTNLYRVKAIKEIFTKHAPYIYDPLSKFLIDLNILHKRLTKFIY